jgi:hypothetical protein
VATLEIKKRAANVVWYTNGMIKIENVRFSYPHLDKPYSGKNPDGSQAGKPKFGIVGMLPKKTHAAAKELIVEAMNELLAANKDGKGVTPTVSSDKKFIRNGDDHEKADTYAGHWIVSAREERQPSVRDKQANLVTEPAAINKLIYGGAWGHIMIRPWYQDGQKVGAGYGRRVNAGLVGVQFIRDDKPFGEGRVDDTDAWAAEDGGNGGGDGMDDDDGL